MADAVKRPSVMTEAPSRSSFSPVSSEDCVDADTSVGNIGAPLVSGSAFELDARSLARECLKFLG